MPTLFDWWHYRPLPPTATIADSECMAPPFAPNGVSYAAMFAVFLAPELGVEGSFEAGDGDCVPPCGAVEDVDDGLVAQSG